MRENKKEQHPQRVRRSSGRAYAEIMRGRENRGVYGDARNPEMDDAYEYDTDDTGEYDADGAYGHSADDSYEYDDYEELGDAGEFEASDEPETEWDRRAMRRKNGGSRGTQGTGRNGGSRGIQGTGYTGGSREMRGRGRNGGNQNARRSGTPAGRMDQYQEKQERSAKRRKKRHVWKVFLLIAVLLAAFFVGKNLLQGKNWTIAVFGVDSRNGEMEKGTRSDVIMLVNVNKRTGEVKLASVYRDTYLKIGDGTYNKINAAYEKGGHQQAIQALEENLDVKIDDYMTFSWAAVAKGINALGGVDLEISDAEFSYINAFITETVNSTGIGSTQLKKAGMNHLDGVQAVAYGRLRLMDTDFNRTARQRKVLGLAMDKAKQADFNTLKNAALAVLPEVSTSIGIDDIVPLLRNVDQYQIAETTGFPFSLKTEKLSGQDYVIPTTLESNVIELHRRFFGEDAYTVPSAVKKISQKIGEDSGYTEPGQEAPDFGTGGGIAHKAPQAGSVQPEEQTAATVLPEETERTAESSSEAESETAESSEAGLFDGLFPTEFEEGDTEGTTEELEAPEGGPVKPTDTKEQEQETKEQATKEQATEAPTKPQTADRPQETDKTVTPDAEENQETAGPGANLPAADGTGPGENSAAGPDGEAGPGI